MSKEETGGPAFPYGTAYAGMTLRDYFAAKAMQGMCGSEDWPEEKNMPYMARIAYAVADAMLKAREQ